MTQLLLHETMHSLLPKQKNLSSIDILLSFWRVFAKTYKCNNFQKVIYPLSNVTSDGLFVWQLREGVVGIRKPVWLPN